MKTCTRFLFFIFASLCLSGLDASAAQFNATSELMTYGNIPGSSTTASVSELTPLSTCYILPSLGNTGTYYLRDTYGTGDDQDWLSVDLPTLGGTAYSGLTSATGTFTTNVGLPVTAPLDLKIYIQAFTAHPLHAGTANMFQDFSNIRVLQTNSLGRWQDTCSNLPTTATHFGWTISEIGEQGKATKFFMCGGGPSLLADSSSPYATNNQAWEYDIVRDEILLIPNSMSTGRAHHTVTRLLDGRILVCGGIEGPFGSGSSHFTQVLNTAEIYDPVHRTWSGPLVMNSHRAGHTSTLIESGPDAGKVLIAGGCEGNSSHEIHESVDVLLSPLRETELFDPVTLSFVPGPDMSEWKAGASAITLDNGLIMIAGGLTLLAILLPTPAISQRIELYDPQNGDFIFGPNARMNEPRTLFNMVKLADGRVLVAGGVGGPILFVSTIADAEVYDPATAMFHEIEDIPVATGLASSTLLSNGNVMIAGGSGGTPDLPIPLKSVHIWDASQGLIGAWTSYPDLQSEHAGGMVATQEDGTVCVAGGSTASALSSTDKIETTSF